MPFFRALSVSKVSIGYILNFYLCLYKSGDIQTVVSIDLIWVFFIPFSYNGVYKRPTEFLPPNQFSTFWALKLLFYMFKHNVPSYLTLTFTNRALLFLTNYDATNRKH